jgi:hypothetical protein
MAQIIKNRRGSLDRLTSATGSLQKGEILIATGSSKLTGVTNGQGLVFAAVESGSVVAANRVLQGAVAPIFSASSYGNLMDGVPFYASSSNTLFLLGADGNTTPDLTGNINTFSASVATSFSASNASIASVTGDFSSSVATSFSASSANLNVFSQSVFGFGGLSSSFENSISASSAKAVSDLNSYSASAATTDSASAFQISQLSASVASVGGTFSSSVATDFSASAAARVELSASIATTDNAQSDRLSVIESTYATTGSNVFNGDQTITGSISVKDVSSEFKIEGNGFGQTYLQTTTGDLLLYATNGANPATVNVKGGNLTVDGTISGSIVGIGNVTTFSTSVDSRFSSSAYNVAELSASVASVGGTFSSSVATDFSASTAARVALSASIALTDNAQSDRLDVIESTYATTGSNIFNGTQTVTGSVYVSGNLIVQGSSSLQNITASAVSIGTNQIILNTDAPAFRYAGLNVYDSGSSGVSASLQWDSLNDQWIFVHKESGSATVDSSILLYGPLAQGQGNEQTLTGNFLTKVEDNGHGHHLTTSSIEDNGTKVTINNPLDVTGAISSSTIVGIGNVTLYSQSVDSRVASLESSVGAGGAIGTRVSNLETISSSYLAFTQSYYSDSSSFDTRISASKAEYTSFSASAASGLSSVSGAFATSTSASNYQITELSASVASVGGTFSSSVATDFSASTAARVALSASIASTDSIQSNNIATLTSKTGSYATTGSNVFNGDQVLTGSFDMTGTANFNNAVAVNDSNMNLGNSSSLNLTGGSSIFVAGAGTISGSIVGIGNVTLYSASVNSRFSASVYDISVLSASVASVGGTFSSSVATDFSASNAARVALSASIASDVNTLSSSIYQTDATQSNAITNNSSSFATALSASVASITSVSASLSSVSSSFATSTSASNYQITELSASVASVGGTFSSSVATDFSASTAARVALSASIASDVNTLSTSVDSRLRSEEFKSTTFATTGSNTFKGEQIISSSLIVTNEIKGTGSIFLQPDVNDARKVEIYNTGASDVHIKGTTGLTFLGDDTNYVAINDSLQTITIESTNGVTIDTSVTISAELSASTINGIGNVSLYSQSVDSRFSASVYDISVLSASVASVGGTFSSSVATDFSASNAARVALSASIATIDNTQTGRIDALESYSSSLKTAIELTGSSVTIQGDLLVRGTTTSVNSTTIELGDNIIELNGTGATNGGLYVKDATSPNTETGSLLWDSTNDYWKAGVKDSESKVLLAIGDSVFSSSIQTALSGTFGYTDFSSSIATAFSASNASIASVTGDFSSSVATSFSASAANVTSISGAFATSTSASNANITALSASVASVTGDFSSSVATSFSASAYVVSTLSGSIYLTDATQSNAITDNSSSFATSISASNFRITTLETTIDGGSF